MAERKKQNQREKQLEEEQARRALLQEALEFLMPEGRAQRACNALVDTLGGLDGIFAAPEAALREISGVGPEVARFLRLVIRLSQAYLEERSWNLIRIYDTLSAVEMFRPKFLGRNTEAVCLMLLDGRGRMVYNDVICEGSFSEVPLQVRKLLRLCIDYQVDEVYLAHNHPSGVALPSQNDLLVTDRLLVALNSIDTVLCDHIIFAGDSYFSFLEGGILGRQESIMRQAQEDEARNTRLLEARIRDQKERQVSQ